MNKERGQQHIMSDALQNRLDAVRDRFAEVEALLALPEMVGNPDKFSELSREYAELDPIVTTLRKLEKLNAQRTETLPLLEDTDPGIRSIAAEEVQETDKQAQTLSSELKSLLIPKDPDDDRNLFLEIRAGTGGDEAGLFTENLLNMYARYADSKGWRLEIMSARPGEKGGYKEVVCRVTGRGAHNQLKFESGTHRVQRVPETESQGRIHTSASTVAILPEVTQSEVEIDRKDLRVDTFRASGAGGQHVNKTDSAVRLTHLPTGLVAECQDERSQHKNRAQALALLQAKLEAQNTSQQRQEEDSKRKNQVGSGDRSERIRTYNFPQGRITDHRIGLTLYQLDDVLSGNLDPVIRPLWEENRARQLAALEDPQSLMQQRSA